MFRAAILACSILFCLVGPAEARTVRLRYVAMPPNAAPTANRLKQHFGPLSRAFVQRETARFAHAPSVSVATIQTDARVAGLGDLSSMDIDALVTVVMFELSLEADQDMRDQLSQMQRQAAQRQALRKQQEAMAKQRAGANASLSQLDTVIIDKGDRLDSLSEMSEMESMRLQMAMDRLSKLMDTLSNLLKKIDDSGDAITKSMK
jgi:hypothetical protein